MKLFKTRSSAIIYHEGKFYPTPEDWDTLVNRPGLHAHLLGLTKELKATDTGTAAIERDLLPPIGSQEVWAAGVTYSRSKEARMDESKESGGATFYDKVYDADRPELFFKSLPHRVAGPGEDVLIRKDSAWNVPEPELTLYINSVGSIEAYTIGNDMSSRSIEGENPLYLPQAKTYERSAALGPCLYVPPAPVSPDTTIAMEIVRKGKQMYRDQVQISKMKRQHTELASWLFRELKFPAGCFLMTGTCLVPDSDFTLAPGDLVHITIDGIGTLTNTVNTAN